SFIALDSFLPLAILPRLALPPSEPDRRQLPPRGDRRRVHQTPSLEQLQQLLARRLVVPRSVPPDDLDELVGRALAIALGRQREGEIEARLVVVRIGRNRLLERREVADALGLLGHAQRRPCGRDRGVLVLARSGRRDGREQGPGLIELAGRDAKLGEPPDRFRLTRVLSQDFGVDSRRPRRVALRRRLFGFRQQLGETPAERPGDALNEPADLALRQGPDEAIERLALVEGDDGGNRLDAELTGDLRMIVDIHLDERDLSARVRDRALQRRRKLLARAAPRRPEI